MPLAIRALRLLFISLLLIAVPSLTACDRFGLGGDEDGEDDKKKTKRKKKSDADDGDAEPSKRAKAPESFEGKVFSVGATAELDGLDVKVEELKECKYETDAYNSELEKKGNKFVGALVVFESTAKKSMTAAITFRAHDEEDIVFKKKSVHGTDCDPQLVTSQLETGEKAKGWIGFEVPKDVKGLTARYEHQPQRPDGKKKMPEKQYPVFSLEK